jgi:hypothetical protein
VAAAVRYDAWMYIGLVPAAVLATRGRTAMTASHAIGFVLLSLPFPVVWMAGNWAMHGDPLYPFAYIDEHHRQWAMSIGGGWNEVWTRLQGVVFWPSMALVSLSPGVAALAVAGMVADWRERRDGRWLMAIAVAPLVYYGVRTAVLFNFVPLTRFMATPLAVMLLFVWRGYQAVGARWGPRVQRRAAIASAVLAVLVPAGIGGVTFRVDGRVADVVRPLSPTSTNPRAVMEAAAALRIILERSGERMAVDEHPRYLDLPLVFYSGIDAGRVVPLRWPGFGSRFDAVGPELVVRFDGGRLIDEPGTHVDGPVLTVRGRRYVRLDGFRPPVHVYRR